MAASSSSLGKTGKDSDVGGEFDTIGNFPVRRVKNKIQVMVVRGDGGGDQGKKQRKWAVPARLVSRKFGILISTVFGGGENSSEKSCPRPRDGEKNLNSRRTTTMPFMNASSSSLSSGGDVIDNFPVRRMKNNKLQVMMVSGRNGGGDQGKKQRKWAIPARLVSGKLGVLVSTVFGGGKNSSEGSCPIPRDGGKNLDSQREGKSLKQRIMTMPHFRSIVAKKTGLKQRIMAMPHFRSFISKRTGLKLLRRKIAGGVSHGRSRIVKVAMLKEAGPVKLTKALRRRRQTAPKLEEEEKGNAKEDTELCKKRILMGGRCRPLSFSGIFIYPDGGGKADRPLEFPKSDPQNRNWNRNRNPNRRREEDEEDTEGDYEEDTEGEVEEEVRKTQKKWRLLNVTSKGVKEDDAELCNKRILMGGKCRPLSPSSSIHN